MKQLVMKQPEDLQWIEIPEPDLKGSGECLVRPVAVASCDLDGPIVRGETPIPGPILLGHEGIGEVVEAGKDVETVSPGDLVVIPFQISCGQCENCRKGLTGNCLSVPPRSMYGFGELGGDWGGMLSDLVRVPFADAMLLKVPGELDPQTIASASDNLPDAWRTVAPYLLRSPEKDVLVVGGAARSIALYAVGIARAIGTGTVTYADDDPARLEIASDLGAELIETRVPPGPNHEFEIVVDGGASRESLASACRSTSAGGDCTHVGIIYEPETPVPLLEMYSAGIHFHVGRAAARADLPAVLDLLSEGGFDPSVVTDRVLSFEQAGPALLEPHNKLIFTR